MKILITANTSWNLYNFRLGLMRSLKSKGHEIFAVAPTDEYSKEIENYGIKFINIKVDLMGTNPFIDFKLILDYHRIFKIIKPNIILSYTIKPNIYGSFAAKFSKIPIINNVSGLGTLFIKSSFSSYVAKILYKLSFRFSKHVFFQNKTDRNLFIDYRIVNKKSSSVIPGSGVDTNHFKFNREKNKCISFLFVGRLIADKGVLEYLKAAKEILAIYPDRYFYLVGDITYKNKTAVSKKIIEYYTSNFSQIIYLGKTDNIRNLLRDVDVMVLPSYREGLSKSLIEAGSMSLPLITTDVPGCNELVVNSYNGFLCREKSVEDLKRRIIEIIKMPEDDLIRMGKNSRKIVENKYSEVNVISIYSEMINSFL